MAIGRALLAQPRLLLMDEPLASLDAARKAEILPYLTRLKTALRLPVIYVTHDAGRGGRLADSMVLVEAGRVVRFRSPCRDRRPCRSAAGATRRRRRAAACAGSRNTIPAASSPVWRAAARTFWVPLLERAGGMRRAASAYPRAR